MIPNKSRSPLPNGNLVTVVYIAVQQDAVFFLWELIKQVTPSTILLQKTEHLLN